MRRFRPLLFTLAVLLTSFALAPRLQAADECDEGTVLWYDSGCCSPSSVRQNALRCVGGAWAASGAYRCLTTSC